MRNFICIMKRELVGYFQSPIAYVFIITFLLASMGCTFYLSDFYQNGEGSASLEGFFVWHPWLHLFFIPAIGMRLWAEERHTGSIELLFTFPVTYVEAVLAKFMAAWLFIGVTLALSVTLPLTVCYLGEPDTGPILAGYLGSFLMAGAYLAVTCVMSSLTKSQVVAFILGVIVNFALAIVGFGVFAEGVERLLGVAAADTLSYLGYSPHFQNMLRGIVEVRDLVYFLSIIGAGLILNGLIIEDKQAQ